MDKYYFDYAATTQPDEEIIDVFSKVSLEYFMNNSKDNESYDLEKSCERKILELLNIDDSYEVIFTSGGTEANNLGIIGRYSQSSKKHFITSQIEHPSILESFKHLEFKGHDVDYIQPNNDGTLNIDDILKCIKKNTALISIMSINNEIGTDLQVFNIFKVIKEKHPNIITMTDCVQGLGKVKIDMSNIDMITFSAHKVYGLKNVGILVKKKNIILNQQIFGSKSHIRPGTFSLALKISFVNCFKKAIENIEHRNKLIKERQQYFLEKLNNEKISCNSNFYTGIISLTFKTDALAETIAKYLYDKNIVVSTKAACSQKLNKPSHVLLAVGKTKDEIDKTIRISFSHKTTYEDINILLDALEEVNNVF